MRIHICISGLLMAGSVFASPPKAVTLNVQNMTCRACPITVKKAIEQVPGASNVKIDFEHKTATLHLDLDRASIAQLTKATADAGFPSTAGK